MTWDNLPGWSEDILRFNPYLLSRIPEGGTYVEVGVFLGRNISMIHDARPDLNLYGVDIWAPDYRHLAGVDLVDLGGLPEDADILQRMPFYEAFQFLMQKHAPDAYTEITWLRGNYHEVAHPPADVVFIDADHTYEAGMRDINRAFELLKPGGVVAGHDYHYIREGALDPRFTTLFPGLVQAIDEQAASRGKRVASGCGDDKWSTCWILEDK